MATASGLRQHLAPSGKADNLDFKGGFLVDLAMQGRIQRFAEFDPAAGQRVETLAGDLARRTRRILSSRKIAALTASWGCDGWRGDVTAVRAS